LPLHLKGLSEYVKSSRQQQPFDADRVTSLNRVPHGDCQSYLRDAAPTTAKPARLPFSQRTTG